MTDANRDTPSTGKEGSGTDTDPAAAVAAAARSVDDMERPGERLRESGVL